jgi:hypothetical protein
VRKLQEQLYSLRRQKLALTPIKKDDWESIALATNPNFMAIIERSRKSDKPALHRGDAPPACS